MLIESFKSRKIGWVQVEVGNAQIIQQGERQYLRAENGTIYSPCLWRHIGSTKTPPHGVHRPKARPRVKKPVAPKVKIVYVKVPVVQKPAPKPPTTPIARPVVPPEGYLVEFTGNDMVGAYNEARRLRGVVKQANGKIYVMPRGGVDKR